MSSVTEINLSDLDDNEPLRGLAQRLPRCVAFELGARCVVLIAPIEPLLDGSVDATLTVEAGSDGPEPNAMLVFADRRGAERLILDRLDDIPDPPLSGRSSVWFCEPIQATAPVSLEIGEAGAEQRFLLSAIRVVPVATSRSIRDKRPKAPGNLKRRADWFQGGRKR